MATSTLSGDAIFQAVAAERLEIANLLGRLDAAQLRTPSLCGEWDVKTVGAHLSVAAKPDMVRFGMHLIRHGLNFSKANDAAAKEAARQPIADITETLQRNASSRFAAPRTGKRAPLADIVIHGADIRRPLGLAHAAPEATVATVLEFLTTGNTFGFVGRGWLDELRFEADDLDFAFGSGAMIKGRGLDLAVAMAGRTAALADLSGDGLATLRERVVRR